VHNSDLSVDFTVRWTDEDNYILKYIENKGAFIIYVVRGYEDFAY
jgi:hypothetical protein